MRVAHTPGRAVDSSGCTNAPARGGAHVQVGGSSNPALLSLLACLPVAVAVATVGVGPGYDRGMALVSVAALLFGGWTFWVHGGRQITAAGVFSLASATFVGYAGLWWTRYLGDQVPPALFAATAAAYLTHVAMYVLFWRGQGRGPTFAVLSRAPQGVSSWAITVGAAGVAISVAMSKVLPDAPYSVFGFAGVVMLALGFATRAGGDRLSLPRLIMVGASVAVYALTLFNGYGRLVVVTLMCACGVVLASRFDGRTAKAVMMLGAPAAATVLSHIRHDVVAAHYGTRVADQRGADSTEGPLQTFSRLMDGSAPYAHGHGSTFFDSIVVVVPHQLWAGKPIGFGAKLTEILEPNLISSKHSFAALSAGEWYFNFGILGLVAMVPVVGWSIRRLDRCLSDLMTRQISGAADLLKLALVVTAVAGMADLMWNGTSTFLARAVFRALVLVSLLLLVDRRTKPWSRRRGNDSSQSEAAGNNHAWR